MQSPVAQVHASSKLALLTTPTVSKAARRVRRRLLPMRMAAPPLLQPPLPQSQRGRLVKKRRGRNRWTPSMQTAARAAEKRSARNHPAAASARPNARPSISHLPPKTRLQPAAGRAAGRMPIEHRLGVGTSLRMTACDPRILRVGGKVGTPIKDRMDGVTGPQTMCHLRGLPVERRTWIRG